MTKTQVLHYPRLDTVIMVEDTLQKIDFYPTKTQLWKKLPKQIMYQTFSLILKYLEDSGKIMIKNSQIIWVWNPKRVKQILAKPQLIKILKK